MAYGRVNAQMSWHIPNQLLHLNSLRNSLLLSTPHLQDATRRPRFAPPFFLLLPLRSIANILYPWQVC